MESATGSHGDHYYSAEPTSAPRKSSFRLDGSWGSLEVSTSSGIFSAGGLDKGTEVLLDHIERTERGHFPAGSCLLDLGCGSGVLALVMGRLYPECRVLAVDINRRALELCAKNAASNGVANVECLPPDEVEPDLRFSLLWTNPPIRIGKTALHDLLGTWLSRLEPSGNALLVVGRHLGSDSLARWLVSRNLGVERVHSSRGFRVLRVRPGKDSDDQNLSGST